MQNVPNESESPFDLIQNNTNPSSLEDLKNLTEKERAAGDIWVGKINQYIHNDITNVISGPSVFCITFVFEGKGKFSIKNGQPVPIEPNTAVIFYSPMPCEGIDHIYKNSQLHCVHVRFSELQARDFEKFITQLLVPTFKTNGSTQDALLASVPMNTSLKNIANDMYLCQLEKDSIARQVFMQAKSLEGLSYLINFLEQSITLSLPLTKIDKQRVYHAADLIDQDFHSGWTIASLAKEVGLNEKKLKLGFRKLIDSTVHKYLEKTRLIAAKEMLQTGISVTDTAIAVGYSSPSHFSKYFKRHFHLTPNEWKKQN